jgi:hypothetical protein
MTTRNQDDDLTAKAQSSARVRSQPKKFVPTSRLTVFKQLEILRGFAVTYQTTKEPVSNDQVAKVSDVKPSTVAMTNYFFKRLGLLLGKGNRFTPCDETIAFSSAFQWDPSTAAHKLAPRFEGAWFATAVSAHLKMRPITVNDAIRILAEDSGASKHYEDQLQMCLRFLDAVGLISITGDQISAAEESVTQSVLEQQSEPVASPPSPPSPPNPLRTWSRDVKEGDVPAVLFLDPAGERRIELHAPPSVTKSELERIQQWLGFQLIVSGEE